MPADYGIRIELVGLYCVSLYLSQLIGKDEQNYMMKIGFNFLLGQKGHS